MSARGAAPDESRRTRWTEATQKPLAVAGVAFVVGYVVFVLWQHPPDAVLGILVILLIVVLIFGTSRIPELGRGLGEGIRNFKKSVKGDDEAPGPPRA